MKTTANPPAFKPGDRVEFVDGSFGIIRAVLEPDVCVVVFSPSETYRIKKTSLTPRPLTSSPSPISHLPSSNP